MEKDTGPIPSHLGLMYSTLRFLSIVVPGWLEFRNEKRHPLITSPAPKQQTQPRSLERWLEYKTQ